MERRGEREKNFNKPTWVSRASWRDYLTFETAAVVVWCKETLEVCGASLSGRTALGVAAESLKLYLLLGSFRGCLGPRMPTGSSRCKARSLLISLFVLCTNTCPSDQTMKMTFPKMSASIKMQFDERRRKTWEKLIFLFKAGKCMTHVDDSCHARHITN